MEVKDGFGKYNEMVIKCMRTLFFVGNLILLSTLALHVLPIGINGLSAAMFPAFIVMLVFCSLIVVCFVWLLYRVLKQEMNAKAEALNTFIKVSEALMVLFGCLSSCAGVFLVYVNRVLEFVHHGLTWKSTADELARVLHNILGMADEWGELTWLMQDRGRAIKRLWFSGSALCTVRFIGIGFLCVFLLATLGAGVYIQGMNRHVNVITLSKNFYRLYAVYVVVVIVAAVAGAIAGAA